MAFWSRQKKTKGFEIPSNAKKEASGLASIVLQEGTGEVNPLPIDQVLVHYTGWNSAGEQFATSRTGEPKLFRLNAVIQGWTEGLQLMVPGEARRFWIPSKLAYGDHPTKGRPAGDLVYEVELMEIRRFGEVPNPPSTVRNIPFEATKERSGLAWQILKKGHGAQKPNKNSLVKVHYSGWSTGGTIFECTHLTDEPAEISLDQVIPGWSEGLLMMVEGERRRFWIPANLAYGDNPPVGAPAGMLIFDIDLLEILS